MVAALATPDRALEIMEPWLEGRIRGADRPLVQALPQRRSSCTPGLTPSLRRGQDRSHGRRERRRLTTSAVSAVLLIAIDKLGHADSPMRKAGIYDSGWDRILVVPRLDHHGDRRSEGV